MKAAVLKNCFGRERWANCLIATVDGVVVGYAIVCPTFEGDIGRRQIYMSDLFLQKTGAGRALLAAVARHGRKLAPQFRPEHEQAALSRIVNSIAK